MEKCFSFIRSLNLGFYDYFGFPTIKVYDGFVELVFKTTCSISCLSIKDLPAADFRFYAEDDSVVFVFTFSDDED